MFDIATFLQNLTITYIICLVIIFIIKITLATLVCFVAKSKGYDPVAWFILGFFWFVIPYVIIHSLPNKKLNDEKLINDLLLQYKSMKNEGIITEEEFIEKKKELLAIEED